MGLVMKRDLGLGVITEYHRIQRAERCADGRAKICVESFINYADVEAGVPSVITMESVYTDSVFAEIVEPCVKDYYKVLKASAMFTGMEDV